MDNLTSIRRSLQFLVMLATFVTAYFARDLILPVVLGFLLALTLSPVARTMERAGIPRGPSGAALAFGAGALILLVIAGTAGTIASWGTDFPSMGREIQQKLSGMTAAVDDMRAVTEEVEKLTTGDAAPAAVEVKQPGFLASAFDTLTQIGATFAVTMILALFLLSSGELFYRKLVQAFPTMTEKKRALTTVYGIERRVSRYLLTITLINAGLGLAIGVFLTAMGLPSAYVWGVIAFLLNFLPYIGGFIGTVLVAGYAIVAFDSVGYALLAPLGYQVITSIEGQLITPWLVGKRLAMNTVAVFLTVVFWGWLWGIPGALVAVPVLVVFKVICENFEPLRTIGIFLSGEDDTPPDQTQPLADK